MSVFGSKRFDCIQMRCANHVFSVFDIEDHVLSEMSLLKQYLMFSIQLIAKLSQSVSIRCVVLAILVVGIVTSYS